MSGFKAATQVIDLPSKGWFYPAQHPLATGQLEVYCMTAAHEDILTSRNLIVKGIVLDKLMEALIATPSVKYEDLLIGDKNALMIASRILGYGKEYETQIECPNCNEKSRSVIDLEKLSDKECDFPPDAQGKNEFKFTLPMSKVGIVFRLLTHKDERDAAKELEAMRKGIKAETTNEVTTRMRYSILEVDGNRDRGAVAEFIKQMPARDAKAFRDYAAKVNPNIDLSFDYECPKCNFEDRLEVPINVNFFWPNAGV
jgi:hypothetical protein